MELEVVIAYNERYLELLLHYYFNATHVDDTIVVIANKQERRRLKAFLSNIDVI